MKISKLSLRKINNIDRQIAFFKNKIVEIVDENNGAKSFKFKSGPHSGKIRDFYEFCINGQSLINIISKKYWANEATEDSGFFNTHIGCLGPFGKFWDEVYVRILSQKELTKDQIQTLFDMFKSNYISSDNPISEHEIKEQILDYIVNNFLLYCCQDCGDSGSGGITLNIEKREDKIIWTDNEKITIQFDANEYVEVLESYIKTEYK